MNMSSKNILWWNMTTAAYIINDTGDYYVCLLGSSHIGKEQGKFL